MPQANHEAPTVRWDCTGLRSSACNLTSVRRVPDGVALSFGSSRPGPGGELEMSLLHAVHLEPAAARRLRDLLVKLTSEYEARYRKPE